MKKKEILFNVWDDYWDDGIGRVQKTDGHILDEMSDDEKIPIVKSIYEYIKGNIDLMGVKMELKDTQINFKHLTHVRREYMMERLEKCGLKYKGIPIAFISES